MSIYPKSHSTSGKHIATIEQKFDGTSDIPAKSMKYSTRKLFLFFLITFIWSWSINLPRVLVSAELITLPVLLSTSLGYAAAFGPSVAAFWLTGLTSGRAGVKTLWKGGWEFRFRKIWLIPTLLLMPIAGAITILLLRLFKLPIDWSASLPPAMIMPVGMLIWLLGAYPEEYGWRGYALDRVQAMFSPLSASLILGLTWGLWHLPLHFIDGTTQAVIPVAEFIMQTIILSVLYTWLYNGSRGSIFVASLFHTMGNLTGAVIPYWTTDTGRWVSFLVLLVPSVFIALFKFTRGSHPVG
jgi:membrane protease YdiL (CAAX protease family)